MSKPIVRRILLMAVVVVLVLTAVFWVAINPGENRPLASARLADGRVIQIEGVTYGTNHSIGVQHPLLDRFSMWLPAALMNRFKSKSPYNTFDSESPSLVVWVNALSEPSGTNVDCQGIRVEIADERGNLFGQSTSFWFGGSDFWRVGHVFPAFPRTEETVTVRITPWRTNSPAQLTVANPHRVPPATWPGHSPPLTNFADGLTVVLAGLERRTNGAPNSRFQFETRSIYREPVWEFLENGKVASGWDQPEWTSEDPTGNHGRMLAVTEPVLRYSATVYPNPTNLAAAKTLVTAPSSQLDRSGTNIVWWNLSTRQGANPVEVLGLFPAGVHVFLKGGYQTNPPVAMAPVRGGTPSGWVGQSRWTTPTRLDQWHGHYSNVPVVYLHAPNLDPDVRLGVRLRDPQGLLYAAKPEGQGAPEGVYPFLVDLPVNVTNVVAEVVELRPIKASFDVATGGGEQP